MVSAATRVARDENEGLDLVSGGESGYSLLGVDLIRGRGGSSIAIASPPSARFGAVTVPPCSSVTRAVNREPDALAVLAVVAALVGAMERLEDPLELRFRHAGSAIEHSHRCNGSADVELDLDGFAAIAVRHRIASSRWRSSSRRHRRAATRRASPQTRSPRRDTRSAHRRRPLRRASRAAAAEHRGASAVRRRVNVMTWPTSASRRSASRSMRASSGCDASPARRSASASAMRMRASGERSSCETSRSKVSFAATKAWTRSAIASKSLASVPTSSLRRVTGAPTRVSRAPAANDRLAFCKRTIGERQVPRER